MLSALVRRARPTAAARLHVVPASTSLRRLLVGEGRMASSSLAAASRCLSLGRNLAGVRVVWRHGCGQREWGVLGATGESTLRQLRAMSASTGDKGQSGEGDGNQQAQNSIIEQAYSGESPSDNLPMTTGQKVAAAGRTGMYLGIAGLVLLCGGVIVKELLPTEFSPKTVFDKALGIIQQHPEVTMRIGTKIKGFGRDNGNEGRRNFVSHDIYEDQDGNKICRIKFYVEGTRGKVSSSCLS